MAMYIVRKVKAEDLEDIVKIEQNCFPIAEAATRQQFIERIHTFGNHFYVLEYDGVCVGFINGMVSDREVISDDMYENAELHDENGDWQSIFGLDVMENFRKRGFATLLMQQMIRTAKQENRKGVILTCKENLIPFYEKFGFKNQGISGSVHGGAVWFDMTLIMK